MKEFLGEAGYEAKKFAEEERSRKQEAKKKKKARTRQEEARQEAQEEAPHAARRRRTGARREMGEAEGEMVARHVGGGFPVFYPTRLPAGAAFQESDPYEHVVDPRVYHLKDKEKERHAAYRMVADYQPEYEINYFGVQGIQGWEDPPILDNPSETRTVNGREYFDLHRQRQDQAGRLAPR